MVKHASAQLCWTPLATDSSHTPYPFYVTLSDGMNSTTDTFFIQVNGMPERISYSAIESGCGWVEFHTEVNDWTTLGGSITLRDSMENFVASIGSFSGTTHLLEGKYYVYTTLIGDASAMNTYKDTIWVKQGIKLKIDGVGYTKLPAAGMYELKATSSYSKALDYQWYHLYFGQTIELAEKSNVLQVQLWEDAQYRLVAINDYGCHDTAEWSVQVQTNGLKQVDGKFNIYPNPASGGVWIGTSGGLISVRLYDLSGRIVINKSAQGEKYWLDISGILSGTYILELESEGGRKERAKLMIQ